MSALKQVFASFGIQTDDSGLKKLDAGVSGAISQLKGLGAALAGGALVQGLRHLVSSTTEAGAELKDSSERLGFATQELQTWRYAAKLAGVDAGGLESAFQKLNLAADNARQGAKPQVAAFKALGVAFKDARGEVRPTGELLPEIADGLARIEDPATRSGLAVDLLGRSGTKLIPLLKEGSAGLEKYEKELQELGGGLTDDLIEKSDEYNDNLDRFEFALTGLKGKLVTEFLPTLTKLALSSAKLAASFGKLIEQTNLLKVAGAALAAAAVRWALPLIAANAGAIAMAAGVALAVLAVEDLYTLFGGGKSVIGDFLDAMKPLGFDAQEWVAGLTGVWITFVDILKTAYALGADVVGLFSGKAPGALSAVTKEIEGRPEKERQQRQAKNDAQEKAAREGNLTAFQAAGGNFEAFKERRVALISNGAQANEADVNTPGIAERIGAKAIAKAVPVRGKEAGAAGGKSVTQTNQINVTVPHGTSREMANEIARVAGQEIDRRTRSAHAALREQAL